MRSDIISCELIPGAAVIGGRDDPRAIKTSRTPVRERRAGKLQERAAAPDHPFQGGTSSHRLHLTNFANLNEMLLVLDPAAAAMGSRAALPKSRSSSIERWANYVYHPRREEELRDLSRLELQSARGRSPLATGKRVNG